VLEPLVFLAFAGLTRFYPWFQRLNSVAQSATNKRPISQNSYPSRRSMEFAKSSNHRQRDRRGLFLLDLQGKKAIMTKAVIFA